MLPYITNDQLNNPENAEKVYEIIRPLFETDVFFDSFESDTEKAKQALRDLGEPQIIDLVFKRSV